MANFFADLIGGGAEGVARGIGQLAKDVRTAITGKESMTAQQQADILARAAALEAAGQQLEAQAAQGQIDMNKIDGQSGSFFKGGWRPALGWVCVLGLGYTFLVRPILPWCIDVLFLVKDIKKTLPPMPELDTKELVSLVMALLGFGGMRMVERIRGRA